MKIIRWIDGVSFLSIKNICLINNPIDLIRKLVAGVLLFDLLHLSFWCSKEQITIWCFFRLLSVFGCLDFSLITKRRDKSVRCHYRARRLQNKTLRKCDYKPASQVVTYAHPQRFKVCTCTRTPQTDSFHKRHDSQWPMNKKRMKCPVYILTVHYPIDGNTLSSPYCV